MRKFRFAKLVRDNIVEKIVSDGGNPIWRKLGQDEYIVELKKKLIEETKELGEASEDEVLKELADVQEIIDNLIEAIGTSRNVLTEQQVKKNNQNGSFKNRQYIDVVEVADNAVEIDYYLKNSDRYPEITNE